MINASETLQKLKQSGLLPMLIQRMRGGQGQSIGQTPSETQAPTSGGAPVPGVGGGGQAGPQVKYDPSGAGVSKPAPVAQPYEAFQSVAGLLTNWNERKHKREEAEASNIAQNLMTALENNDVATVHEILNDKHSTKVLDKVYKGWLTKMKESQKPGEEPDPTVTGFEKGLQEHVNSKNQQPTQMPKTMGGYAIPQAGPARQLEGAKLSAAQQTFQQDPNLMKPTQLTSSEVRSSELGAGPQKAEAEIAKAQADIDKAAQGVKKAQLEVQKTEAELKIKQAEASAAETKGKIQIDVEHQRYLAALARVDVEKQRLKNAIIAPKSKQLPVSDRVKIESINKALAIAERVQKEGRKFAVSDVTALSNELKSGGASELVKRLPSEYTTWLHGSGMVDDFVGALRLYKEGIEKGFTDAYPDWNKTPEERAKSAKAALSGGGDSEDEPGSDDEPMEGDVVDGYRFKGGDPAVQSNWEPAEKKP